MFFNALVEELVEVGLVLVGEDAEGGGFWRRYGLKALLVAIAVAIPIVSRHFRV
jgi:hypothetical protein